MDDILCAPAPLRASRSAHRSEPRRPTVGSRGPRADTCGPGARRRRPRGPKPCVCVTRTVARLPQHYARIDTAVGACATQLIMIAVRGLCMRMCRERRGRSAQVIITTAGSLWTRGEFPDDSGNFETIPQFANALTDHLGAVVSALRRSRLLSACAASCAARVSKGPGQGAVLHGHSGRRYDGRHRCAAVRGVVSAVSIMSGALFLTRNGARARRGRRAMCESLGVSRALDQRLREAPGCGRTHGTRIPR
jgi:hypothetical protein